ncbi:MAG: hypothetical protein ACXWCS_14325, partial [Burkholderiales bacterium]
NFIASYAVPGLRELNNLLGTVASANQTTATKPSGMYYCAECDDDIRPTEDHYSTCSKARRCGGPATGTDNHARDDKGGYWDGWADGREAADAKIDAAERERDTLRDLLARKEAGEAEFVALRNHQMQAAYKREEDERQRADAAEREAQEHFDNYQEMGEQVVQRDRRIVELEAALKQMPHDSCVEENLPRCKYEGCGDGGGMDWEAAVCNIARAALAAPASPATANQCDGCRAGRPIDANGNHRMGDGEYGDLMHCQREKYVNLDTHSKEPK